MRWILSLIACLPLTLSGCRPNPPPTESAAVELPAAESPAAESPLETPSEPPAEAAWDVQFAAVRSGRSDRLRIAQQPVTPEQLQQLPQIGEHLRHLLIDRGGVRDQDLATLSQLRRLVHLRIRQSPLSDDGLALLLAGELPELQILNLPQSQLTARGI
ncbi:MAG: hypothetical protein KDA45_10480, partial [Planctomycetales bacterium]|nr:hypothetical protein [Planctomycetales bacterium]